MAPSFCIDLRESERAQLLGIARRSIHEGFERGNAPLLALHELPAALTASLGVFITLTRHDALRGCIGAMESSDPLAQSVAESAYSAAFRDPRFPQLEAHELDTTAIEISILSPLEQLPATSRSELLATLRSPLDGLLLQDKHHRSTFLPKVWEQLPDPELFLDHLLTKAGLPADHWSASLQFYRYNTVCFSEANQMERD